MAIMDKTNEKKAHNAIPTTGSKKTDAGIVETPSVPDIHGQELAEAAKRGYRVIGQKLDLHDDERNVDRLVGFNKVVAPSNKIEPSLSHEDQGS